MKTKEKGYQNKHLRNFNQLKDKLRLLLTDNPQNNRFKFYGVSKDGKLGVLVCGIDSMGVREFKKFWSIPDIQFYYGELNKRLQRR